MCGICGCSEGSENHQHADSKTLTNHHHGQRERVQVERDLLAQNRSFAKKNQQAFLERKISAINLMSSPGSGKTTLLGQTIRDLQNRMDIAVVVGDQQTQQDADALIACGAQAIQINTGKVCHLDAHMLGHSLDHLQLKENSILFIENIGNLVCPALFDLGESYKIVILSVAEGDNKPLKYPDMFHCADLMIITKTDLLPYVEFDIEQCISYAKRINPAIQCLTLSAKTGEGLNDWYAWLAAHKAP